VLLDAVDDGGNASVKFLDPAAASAMDAVFGGYLSAARMLREADEPMVAHYRKSYMQAYQTARKFPRQVETYRAGNYEFQNSTGGAWVLRMTQYYGPVRLIGMREVKEVRLPFDAQTGKLTSEARLMIEAARTEEGARRLLAVGVTRAPQLPPAPNAEPISHKEAIKLLKAVESHAGHGNDLRTCCSAVVVQQQLLADTWFLFLEVCAFHLSPFLEPCAVLRFKFLELGLDLGKHGFDVLAGFGKRRLELRVQLLRRSNYRPWPRPFPSLSLFLLLVIECGLILGTPFAVLVRSGHDDVERLACRLFHSGSEVAFVLSDSVFVIPALPRFRTTQVIDGHAHDRSVHERVCLESGSSSWSRSFDVECRAPTADAAVSVFVTPHDCVPCLFRRRCSVRPSTSASDTAVRDRPEACTRVRSSACRELPSIAWPVPTSRHTRRAGHRDSG
jgi:hypothetical protein